MFAGMLSSILAGGATGLLGMFFQRLFDGVFQFLKAKQDLAMLQEKNKQEAAMKQIDLQIMQSEYAGKLKVAVAEGETAKDVAETQAFAASLGKEPERYAQGDIPKNAWGYVGWFLMILVDALRAIIRPGLTVYLAWITTQVYREAKVVLDLRGATLTSNQAMDLVTGIISTILYLFTTCVLWYFGTRNRQQPPKLK